MPTNPNLGATSRSYAYVINPKNRDVLFKHRVSKGLTHAEWLEQLGWLKKYSFDSISRGEINVFPSRQELAIERHDSNYFSNYGLVKNEFEMAYPKYSGFLWKEWNPRKGGVMERHNPESRFVALVRQGRREGKKKNPTETLEKAEHMSREFHGREPRNYEEIEEAYKYPKSLANLGKLIEIEVMDPEDEEYLIPIEFTGKGKPDLCCTPNGKQLFAVGGNQKIDIGDFGLEDSGKQYYDLGVCYSLSYEADKHHLEGSSGKVEPYIHELGEESGFNPMLVYDSLNQNLLFVGGNYHVEDRGIVD